MSQIFKENQNIGHCTCLATQWAGESSTLRCLKYFDIWNIQYIWIIGHDTCFATQWAGNSSFHLKLWNIV